MDGALQSIANNSGDPFTSEKKGLSALCMSLLGKWKRTEQSTIEL